MKKTKEAKALTITFLTPVSFASLNGSDNECDNMSSIKKLTRGSYQYPYVSSQAIRRALRDQLANLGFTLSEGVVAKETKGAATTKCEPQNYIDDDLFGFMNAVKNGNTTKRTSAVRVTPLISLEPFNGDLDFGTNYMSVKEGGNPNIFETEIHAGLYRGTVLLELDRIGCGDGFEKELPAEEKRKRALGIINSLQNLWGSGRQSRFLADLSPKFVAAAITTVKSPLFAESVIVKDNCLREKPLLEATQDNKEVLVDHVFGARSEILDEVPEETVTLGEAFAKIKKWVVQHYEG